MYKSTICRSQVVPEISEPNALRLSADYDRCRTSNVRSKRAPCAHAVTNALGKTRGAQASQGPTQASHGPTQDLSTTYTRNAAREVSGRCAVTRRVSQSCRARHVRLSGRQTLPRQTHLLYKLKRPVGYVRVQQPCTSGPGRRIQRFVAQYHAPCRRSSRSVLLGFRTRNLPSRQFQAAANIDLQPLSREAAHRSGRQHSPSGSVPVPV